MYILALMMFIYKNTQTQTDKQTELKKDYVTIDLHANM